LIGVLGLVAIVQNVSVYRPLYNWNEKTAYSCCRFQFTFVRLQCKLASCWTDDEGTVSTHYKLRLPLLRSVSTRRIYLGGSLP